MRNLAKLVALLLPGCVVGFHTYACDKGLEYCIVDSSTTEQLDADYSVTGNGDPRNLLAGMGVLLTDDGMIEVFPVDDEGCRVNDGEPFFIYPEVIALESAKRAPTAPGSGTSSPSYGSGGGGGKICK